MQSLTIYYWKIVAKDNYGGETTGTIWDFTTVYADNDPPYAPSDPDPYNGETNVEIDHDLSWTGGDPNPGDTVTYDVYFGTSSPPSEVATGISDTTYDPGTLDYNQIYYWKIVSWDNQGAYTSGSEWSFTTKDDTSNTAPNPPSINGPSIIRAGQYYDFTFLTTDPDDDDIKYIVNWGDGPAEETELVLSGTAYQMTHLWDPQLPVMPYQITCKAEDANGAQSSETIHWILVLKSTPQNRQSSQQNQQQPIQQSLIRTLSLVVK